MATDWGFHPQIVPLRRLIEGRGSVAAAQLNPHGIKAKSGPQFS